MEGMNTHLPCKIIPTRRKMASHQREGMSVINEVKSFLSKCFDMKDLGEADVILNIKLIKDESGITLTQ